MIDLEGRVYIVTGGNGGIGLGMAEGIVQAGGRVVVWGRKADKNAEAVAALQQLGGEATSYVCDVSDLVFMTHECLGSRAAKFKLFCSIRSHFEIRFRLTPDPGRIATGWVESASMFLIATGRRLCWETSSGSGLKRLCGFQPTFD